MNTPPWIQRRRLTAGLLGLAVWPVSGRTTQRTGATAFPYYSGEQTLQALYGQHLPPLARDFETQARALSLAARLHCADRASLTRLRDAWRRALLSWQTLSSPGLGPVLERRSQRQIDSWPIRPALLEKALKSAPRSLDDLERIGTPAKGFPALEHLITGKAGLAHCPYLALLADGIAAEATALREGFEALGGRDWTQDEDGARTAFAEWINQWLGGFERLRWAHIEQPVQKARTAGQGGRAEFARLSPADNRTEWLTQWRALRAQAQLTPGQRREPPQPGQGLIPIEALLMGKGHIALAQRWSDALDAADTALQRLPVAATERELIALSRTFKGVTTLYQAEVAAALDVPLGFSDADGD